MKYRCDKALHYLECKIESLDPYPYLIFVRFLTFPPGRQAAGQGCRNVKKLVGLRLHMSYTYLINFLDWNRVNGSTQNWWCPIPHVLIRSGGPVVGHMKDIPIFHMTDNSCLDFLRQRLSVIIFLSERKFDLIFLCVQLLSICKTKNSANRFGQLIFFKSKQTRISVFLPLSLNQSIVPNIFKLW